MNIRFPLLASLFALSGLAALVYEAIWARYLKLLLGHSSYGQILALCIFMGGIGIGSFLAGAWVRKAKRPLLGYAFVEGGLGLLGFLYHSGYTWISGRILDAEWLQGMSGWKIVALKCLAGSGITLPMAILMGMTFPLMVTALLRQFPSESVRWIGRMYFANALGGVFGVLLTSFVLVPHLGTTGSLLFAGTVNILIGCLVYLAGKSETGPETATQMGEGRPEPMGAEANTWVYTLLAVSALTGLSSFFYEVGWIRLLSLAFGSSTHSFDLMVAAFILGIALGSYCLQRFPSSTDSAWRLAWIQVAMGASACLSIYLYNFFFSAIDGLNLVLVRNEAGYWIFSLAKWTLSILMMCPTSFFAGMTLPLITAILWNKTGEEAFTGKVYGWNTFGSIVGAALGGLVVLPWLQLEKTIALGAAVDIALGGLIFVVLARRTPGRGMVLGAGALVLAGTFFVRFDVGRISAGAYRGVLPGVNIPDTAVTIAHGRTATISVHFSPVARVLKTNGKPDASIFTTPGGLGIGDNLTQSGLAYFAMGTRTAPYRAAVIGLGSGMTTHYLLGDSALKRLDLIEIEEAVYRLARHFRPYNERVFTDGRMRKHFEDARTFFASEPDQFDVIISEPSNPWVSGVSSLFTREFYGMIRKHLSGDGVLVQWLHAYEISDPILLSIFKAIAEVFPDFEIYRLNEPGRDLVILIHNRAARFPGLERMSRDSVIRKDFESLGLPIDHFAARRFVASRACLAPLLGRFNPNSDYFPIVDSHAEKSFFTQENARLLKIMSGLPLSYARLAAGDKYANVWEEKRRQDYAKAKPAPWKLEVIRDALAAGQIPSADLQTMVGELIPLEVWAELDRESNLLAEVCARLEDSAASHPMRLVLPLFYYESRQDTARALRIVERMAGGIDPSGLNYEAAKQMFLTALWGKNDRLAREVYVKFFSRFTRESEVEDLLARKLILGPTGGRGGI